MEIQDVDNFSNWTIRCSNIISFLLVSNVIFNFVLMACEIEAQVHVICGKCSIEQSTFVRPKQNNFILGQK